MRSPSQGGSGVFGGPPDAVAAALASYRELLTAHGPRWAETSRARFPAMARHLRYAPVADLTAHAARQAAAGLPGPDAGPGAEPGAGPDGGPGAESDVEPGGGPGAGPGAGPDVEPGTEPDGGPGAGPGGGPGPGAGLGGWAGADLDRALRDALRGRDAGSRAAADGLIVLRITAEGSRADPGPARALLPGTAAPFALLLDSAVDREIAVHVAGRAAVVPPGGARLIDIEVAADPLALEVAGEPVTVPGLVREAEPAWLRLRSREWCRWSVYDAAGTGWFPEDALRKWDAHGRPYFHGGDVRVRVPAGPLTIRVARGMEYGTAETAVEPGPWEERVVPLDPPRVLDPAARGWYGGDLHLHMNFGGDQVCEPRHAAGMQHGEGLHVMSPLAANCATAFVFDRAALETWAGRDLPWSVDGAVVARMGAEYRNDLLGHVSGFGPSAPPPRYNAGHADSDRPDDHPPNAVACRELRSRGAVVCAAHPVARDLPPPPEAPAAADHLLDPLPEPALEPVFEQVFDVLARSGEARELVADAALGLIDGVDLLTHNSCTATAAVYRRLLGAGLRPAATAGTDVFLSYGRCGTHSNPPGWARAYARLDGPLDVPRYQEAIRRGRTFATNGPWLELDVAGRGIGETIAVEPGGVLTVRAEARGPGVRRVRIRTADGVAASSAPSNGGAAAGGRASAWVALTVTEPTYVVAEADGDPHPDVLDPRGPYAHTSPVHVEVGGRRVARAADARWCLDWLDRLERLVREHGAYRDASPDEVLAVLDEARAYYAPIASSEP